MKHLGVLLLPPGWNASPLQGDLAPVVRKVDSAIQWINHYPADKSQSSG